MQVNDMILEGKWMVMRGINHKIIITQSLYLWSEKPKIISQCGQTHILFVPHPKPGSL